MVQVAPVSTKAVVRIPLMVTGIIQPSVRLIRRSSRGLVSATSSPLSTASSSGDADDGRVLLPCCTTFALVLASPILGCRWEPAPASASRCGVGPASGSAPVDGPRSIPVTPWGAAGAWSPNEREPMPWSVSSGFSGGTASALFTGLSASPSDPSPSLGLQRVSL